MTRVHAAKKKKQFLEEFSKCVNISVSCERIGVSRDTYYKWREKDPKFAQAFEDCDTSLTEKLESKAVAMALAGEVPVLTFLLRARRPAKYRDNHNVTVEGIVPLHVMLSDERGGDSVIEAPSFPKPNDSGLDK